MGWGNLLCLCVFYFDEEDGIFAHFGIAVVVFELIYLTVEGAFEFTFLNAHWVVPHSVKATV